MGKRSALVIAALASACMLSAEGSLTLSAGGTAAEGDSLPVAFLQGTGTVSFRRAVGVSSFVGLSADGSLRAAGSGGDITAGGGLTSRLSRRTGPAVAGVEAALEAFTGGSDTEEYSLFSLGFPLNLNLDAVSFMLTPAGTLLFGSIEGARASLEGEAHFALGDFVLKPSLGGAFGRYYQGYDETTLTPSLGLSWYPGFPASASFSVELNRRINADDGSESYVTAAEGSLAVSPAQYILISLDLAGTIEDTQVSYSGVLGTEVFPPSLAGTPGAEGQRLNFSFPLEIRVLYDSIFGVTAEGSLGIRVELP